MSPLADEFTGAMLRELSAMAESFHRCLSQFHAHLGTELDILHAQERERPKDWDLADAEMKEREQLSRLYQDRVG